MSDKQKVKLTNSKVTLNDFRKLHNTGENFVTESGLYKLIFKSKAPKAEEFSDWVADEVLPEIRKVGSYQMDHGNTKTKELIGRKSKTLEDFQSFEIKFLSFNISPFILKPFLNNYILFQNLKVLLKNRLNTSLKML